MSPARWWGVAASSAAIVAALSMATGVAPRRAYAGGALAKPFDRAELRSLALQVALDRNGFSPGEIVPGPNNPVGFVWIGLNREHLGAHGTPTPSTVGRSGSHGCIRLTNWDALRLASLVSDGTRVVLQ